AAILVAAIIFLMAFPPVVTVPTGHTGVVTTFGRVEDKVLTEGFHVKNPFQKVIMMDNRAQRQTIRMSAFSSDIQQVEVTCTVNYSIDQVNAQNLYKNVGENYYYKKMEPRIKECTKSVFTRYTAENLMEVRNTLSNQIEELLSPEMLEIGIRIETISIEDVDFTDAFTDAVEAKQVALQKKLKTETEQAELVSVAQSTAERDIIAAKADAEKRAILAQAEADVKKIEADAEAYAVKVKAEAEANANELISASLTDALIAYTEANRWDGKLPQFMGSGATLPIIDLDDAE
ncbi:MAG: prohibitin family protein, partial [Clostridia bacterium]|nr:prohibitin family protein [Clostridia bacterium]